MQRFLIFTICVLMPCFTQAQNKKYEETGSSQDSVKIYNKIHKFALKRKITYWLYSAIFIEPKPYTPVPLVKKSRKKIIDPFIRYKGKIIRKIEFVTLDPFGTDVNNIDLEQKNFFIKAGNKLHVKTTRFAIRNQVLFKKGKPVDPLQLRETERLIRQSGYIRDARVLINPIKEEKDSVDVVVITQDVWSITGSAAVNTSSGNLKFRDKNFVGSGQLMENNITYNYNTNPGLDIIGSYTAPNIRKTFVSGSIYYRASALNYYEGISFTRQFYSPITKWAGGINTMWSHSIGSFTSTEGLITTFPVQYNLQDLWLGRSFQIFQGRADVQRSSRFVVTSRIYRQSYSKRPGIEMDSLRTYQPSTLYLSSVGYSTRLYYKDKNIFRFGYTEDVPEGRLFALIGGVEDKEFYSRWYTGVKMAAGEHINNFGYLAAGFEYGTFFRDKKIEKAVINSDLTYFTDLMQWGKWSMRQFIYCKFVHGARRDPNERININSDLYGFTSDPVSGTTTIFLNLQNVVYTPLRFIGFQFAFVGFAGFGMVGEKQRPLFKTQVYQAYGVGVLIRNEHLVLNTFQVSIGFYPNLAGANSYKLNPISSYNLRIKDYYLSKPELISYQ